MANHNHEKQQGKEFPEGGADSKGSPRPEGVEIKMDGDMILTGAKIYFEKNLTVDVAKRRGAPEPFAPKDKTLHEKSDTPLFIGISAFRDKRCSWTLYNLFTKAKYPDRLSIGVVQQWDEDEDEDCLEGYCNMVKELNPEMWEASDGICPRFHQVTVMRLDYRESMGPCYARHFQSYMLRDEEFCMQIDSHMDTILDWDKELMDMWGRANNEYGILSVYVNRISDLPKPGHQLHYVPHLCKVFFTGPSGKQPRYMNPKYYVSGLKAPLLSNAYAGGFNFGKCHSWKAVPYDPGLNGVFNGEEFSMASRLWTSGYDFYTPDRAVIGHDYVNKKVKHETINRSGQNSWFYNEHLQEKKVLAYEHLDKVLGINGTGNPELREIRDDYGLGDRRSWLQLQEFIGVNLTTLERFADSCGNLEWVPFNEGPWPPTVNNLKGQYWEERKAAELLSGKQHMPHRMGQHMKEVSVMKA